VEYVRLCGTDFRSKESAMNIELSEAARALLRYRLATKDKTVTDANREAYRELARAGIMYPVSGFVSGPEYQGHRILSSTCE
jgi:hypothetical protein